MHTLVFATQKGGCGKSTLAAGIALAAQHAGHLVRLIDTDPQATLSNWQSRRLAHDVVVDSVHEAGEIEPELRKLRREGTDLAIIDTSAGMNAATRTAILCADLCLLPTRPSIADLESTVTTLRVVRAARRPFAFILNQASIRGERGNLAASALSREAEHELAEIVALPFIASRNDHQDALAAGLTAVEYAPDGKAADEIRRLWEWIEARLQSRLEQSAPTDALNDDTDVPWDSCL
ncbi:ParA family protein [Bradyrhizobium sp. BR13661]|jgi:chromosome partitioning protein|uniref:ParA family protein n=1 Tax=Bradyrhizobium sp. BR13661 TaxID=2940622 RepID=UPI0024748A0C|nr:ParA family protein [Bradyrhizobium sp. BR13661]MDH6261349.1 chromosome partitioning protein [Bradyrhizobium sp. BR13661]